MNCKHKQIIRIVNNKQEYYCTAKQKEITKHDCRGCMLYNEKLDDDLQSLVNLFFRRIKKMSDLDDEELKATRKLNGVDKTMTEEQEEAIKLAKDFTKMDFSNPMGWTGYYDTELNELSIAIDTVLNMLKEKDKEIEKLKKENEHWKNGFERELEDNRKNTCELLKQDLIIRKKDKQIDLMAEFIYAMWCVYPGSFTKALRDRGFDDKECGTCESKEKNCLDFIKQYFKSKAEKE